MSKCTQWAEIIHFPRLQPSGLECFSISNPDGSIDSLSITEKNISCFFFVFAQLHLMLFESHRCAKISKILNQNVTVWKIVCFNIKLHTYYITDIDSKCLMLVVLLPACQST